MKREREKACVCCRYIHVCALEREKGRERVTYVNGYLGGKRERERENNRERDSRDREGDIYECAFRESREIEREPEREKERQTHIYAHHAHTHTNTHTYTHTHTYIHTYRIRFVHCFLQMKSSLLQWCN